MRQVLCPLVVGRDGELALLGAALAAAREGRGGVLVVSGEAGIGKTRLTHEAERLARESGMKVLRGRAVHREVQLPFRPLVDALRLPLMEDVPADVPELEPFRAALGRLAPERGRADVSEAEPRVVLSEAIRRVLRVLARDDGLLLALEDLHWADADTLDVVEYLADTLRSERVLCLCTERSDWPGPAADVLATLVARRAVRRIALEQLSDGAVEEMARASLEEEPVPAAVIGALRRRAEGVPFLIEEMLSAYVAAREAASGGAEWWVSRKIADGLPPSYRELVRARLAALGEEGRRVVGAAAVLGRTFDWQLVRATTGLGEDAVLAALRAAAEAHLVTAADGAAFSFRHALARETILADLLPPEAAELCTRAADAIEDTHPGVPGEWCERAADLRVQAEDRLGACRLLQEAGRRALARGALATAEAMLVRARELVVDDPMASLGGDELLVQALALAGKTEGLVELGSSLLAGLDKYLALSTHPVSRTRRAQLHLHVARGGLLSGDPRLAREHLDAARRMSGGDEAMVARTDSLEARLALANGDPERAREHAAAAARSAARLDLPDVLCEALEAQGRAAFRSGDFDRAREAFEAMEQAALRHDLTVRRVHALVELGTLDRLAGADPGRLEEARRLATSAGAVSALARIDHELGWLHLGLADLPAAHTALQRAAETCRRFGPAQLPEVLVAQAMLCALRGRRTEVEQSIAEAIAVAGGDANVEAAAWGCGRAVLRLVLGERDGALDALDAAVAAAGRASSAHPWWFHGLWALLRSAPAGDDGAARGTLRGAGWLLADPANRAYLAYADAIAAGREGRADLAQEFFDGADARMPPGWRRHHARAVAGEAAASDGWGAPGSWAEEAAAFFDGVGLARMASHARGVMRKAGVRVPRRGRGTAEVPEALRARGVTSREMDVLQLVALGLSNADIGARLFLSPRTVEAHVTSLMRKTAVASRPELVALAARHVPDPR